MKIRDLMRILKRINPDIPIEVNNQPIRRIDRAFNEKRELRIVLFTYSKEQETEIAERDKIFDKMKQEGPFDNG